MELKFALALELAPLARGLGKLGNVAGSERSYSLVGAENGCGCVDPGRLPEKPVSGASSTEGKKAAGIESKMTARIRNEKVKNEKCNVIDVAGLKENDIGMWLTRDRGLACIPDGFTDRKRLHRLECGMRR